MYIYIYISIYLSLCIYTHVSQIDIIPKISSFRLNKIRGPFSNPAIFFPPKPCFLRPKAHRRPIRHLLRKDLFFFRGEILVPKMSSFKNWLVVEPTHLKNMSKNGNLPPIFGVEINNIWNHHLEKHRKSPTLSPELRGLLPGQHFPPFPGHKFSGKKTNLSYSTWLTIRILNLTTLTFRTINSHLDEKFRIRQDFWASYVFVETSRNLAAVGRQLLHNPRDDDAYGFLRSI